MIFTDVYIYIVLHQFLNKKFFFQVAISSSSLFKNTLYFTIFQRHTKRLHIALIKNIQINPLNASVALI